MQDLPDAPTVLGEVARFLGEKVRPAIDDRGLAFRVRIASHLLGMLAREATLAGHHLQQEAARLAALFEEPAPTTDVEAWVLARNARLARALRADELDTAAMSAVRAHLLDTLRDTLAVVQPDFDTRLDPDTEPSV